MAINNGSSRDGSRNTGKLLRLKDRLLWICPTISLIAGIVILWLFGFSLWTSIAFVFLIACPLIIAWVLMIERQQNPIRKQKDERQH